MERISADGNSSGFFTDGNPATGVVATAVDALWLNNIQEELVGIVLGSGATLNPADYTQLKVAINKMIQNGAIPQANFVIANNQVSPAPITGLIFDKTKYYGARINYNINRSSSSTPEVAGSGTISIWYKASTGWQIAWTELNGGDDHGVTFSVDSVTGQISYTSTDIGSTTYSGIMRTGHANLVNI